MRKAFLTHVLPLFVVALIFCAPFTGRAQNREKFVISAQAGGINAVTGRAAMHARGNSDWQRQQQNMQRQRESQYRERSQQQRRFFEQRERRFHPTEIGEAVNDLLVEHFREIVDLRFTASMEGKLDELAETGGDWDATAKVLGDFYAEFERELAEAERKLPKFEQRDEPTDEVCVNCGKPMVIKTGRFGRFMSCTGYPECKTTKPILKDSGAICPKDGGMIAERKSRKGRTFYGCANYPACDFVPCDPVAPHPPAVCRDYAAETRRRRGRVPSVCHTDRTHATGPGAPPENAAPTEGAKPPTGR